MLQKHFFLSLLFPCRQEIHNREKWAQVAVNMCDHTYLDYHGSTVSLK